jgi:hypothetical protein
VGLLLESTVDYSWWNGERADDEWTFEVSEPGVYVPVAVVGERVIGSGPPARIEAGQEHDLGTIVSRPGADLVVEIARDEATENNELWASLRIEGLRRTERIELGKGSRLETRGLEPGRAELTIFGEGVVRIRRDLQLEEGRETRSEVRLVPAVRVPYVVSWDDDDRPDSLTIRVTHREDGKVAYEHTWESLASTPPPFDAWLSCPAGAFVFEALAPDGRSGRGEFAVVTLDAVPTEPLRVDLR